MAVSLFLFISQMFFQEVSEIISDNIFDSLHVLSAPKKDALADELRLHLILCYDGLRGRPSILASLVWLTNISVYLVLDSF